MNQNHIQAIQIVTYPDGRMDTHNTALYLGLSEKTLAMMRCDGTGPKVHQARPGFLLQGRL